MFKKMKKIFFLLSIPLFIFPVISLAQSGSGTTVNPPTGTQSNAGGSFYGITYECAPKTVNGTTIYGECDFDDLVAAVLYLVNWATGFAIAFCVFVIAYAGWELMISGDNSSARSKAKSRLYKVLVGLVIILIAWLIVRLITSALGVNTGITNLA